MLYIVSGLLCTFPEFWPRCGSVARHRLLDTRISGLEIVWSSTSTRLYRSLGDFWASLASYVVEAWAPVL